MKYKVLNAKNKNQKHGIQKTILKHISKKSTTAEQWAENAKTLHRPELDDNSLWIFLKSVNTLWCDPLKLDKPQNRTALKFNCIFSFSGCGIKCKERPMELVFVIDSSESVGPENFEIIKDFVTRLVDRTTVGRNATRIGLVLYSLEVRLEFNLVRYMSKEDVKQAIRKMPYMGEGTYTGTAIRKATQEAFFSARSGVRKVAIVITDGQTDKREPVKLDIAVREAHAANIEMYALGIVNSSDPTQAEFLQELNLIASDPDREHMYLIDDFNTLPGENQIHIL